VVAQVNAREHPLRSLARAGLGGGLANAFKAAQNPKDHMVDEAASPSSRAKSKSIGESPFTFPKFLGKLAFPSEFHHLAEKNALQAKENYDKLKNATEEVTGGFKDAFETAAEGTREYGVRLARISTQPLITRPSFSRRSRRPRRSNCPRPSCASSSKRCRNSQRN
jgi:hypothetical protein